MDGHDEFVLSLVDAQPRLSGYIYSLVLDDELCRDILQKTNLILVEKKSDFQPGTNFLAWACRTAFFEVLADRRDRGRDRHLFNDEMLQVLAVETEKLLETDDQRMDALGECLALLPENYRELILARYRPGGSVAVLATALDKTPAAVSSLLSRIRRRLADCVERRLKEWSLA